MNRSIPDWDNLPEWARKAWTFAVIMVVGAIVYGWISDAMGYGDDPAPTVTTVTTVDRQ